MEELSRIPDGSIISLGVVHQGIPQSQFASVRYLIAQDDGTDTDLVLRGHVQVRTSSMFLEIHGFPLQSMNFDAEVLMSKQGLREAT
jgi:hypothetical protein